MPQNGIAFYSPEILEILRREQQQQFFNARLDNERLRVAEQMQNLPPGYYQDGNWMPASPDEPVRLQEIPAEPIYETPEGDKVLKLINEFLIGCDPELLVLNAEKQHVNVRPFISQNGVVGWDHNGDVLEVRPRPAKSSFTLLRHIWEALNIEKFGIWQYRAGAYFKTPTRSLTLGGHIHINLPLKKTEVESRLRVLALDELTRNFEELDILPKAECFLRRKRGKEIGLNNPDHAYGSFGDVREKANGARLEYRTMASWLFSPITSLLCLTAAKLASAAPRETFSTFLMGDVSKGRLVRFFEMFKEKDADAARVTEKVFESGLELSRDPAADVMQTWKAELKEIGG